MSSPSCTTDLTLPYVGSAVGRECIPVSYINKRSSTLVTILLTSVILQANQSYIPDFLAQHIMEDSNPVPVMEWQALG